MGYSCCTLVIHIYIYHQTQHFTDSTPLSLLDPEDVDTVILQNAGTQLDVTSQKACVSSNTDMKSSSPTTFNHIAKYFSIKLQHLQTDLKYACLFGKLVQKWGNF